MINRKRNQTAPQRKPVWDVNVLIVRSAEEATELLKKAEQKFIAHERKYPSPPRGQMPKVDYEFTF